MNDNRQQARWYMNKTLRTKITRSVRRYTVLDPSLWISGVLNEVFVAGLPGLEGLQFSHSGHALQYACVAVCCAYAFGQCCLRKLCQYPP